MLAPIIEFFLQLVILGGSHNNSNERPHMSDVHSDMTERENLLFAVFGWNLRRATFTIFSLNIIAVGSFTADGGLLEPTGMVKTTPHKTIFAVWISTRNSRTGQKLNKLAQLQQLNCWHEVQSENTNNVWSNLKHLGNLWAKLMPFHKAIMHWRSFVFRSLSSLFCQLVSSSLDCLPCLDVRTLWLKFGSPFIP